jgi:hypothetical protein
MKNHQRILNLIAAARRMEQSETQDQEPLKVRHGTILRWAERDEMLCERIRELESREISQRVDCSRSYYPSSSPDYFTPALSASLAAAIITSSFE